MAVVAASLKQQGYAVYTLDIDEQAALAKAMRVQRVPTIIVWEQRAEVVRFQGIVTAEQLKKHLKHNAPPEYEIY